LKPDHAVAHREIRADQRPALEDEAVVEQGSRPSGSSSLSGRSLNFSASWVSGASRVCSFTVT